MSGNGALVSSGRWHSAGSRVVYSSGSLALATLEVFVNLLDPSALGAYVKTRIEIPEDLVEALPDDRLEAFRADPDAFDSRAVGDRWLAERRSCALGIPSRVILEETNYLLDPTHPEFSRVEHETTSFVINPRLVNARRG